VQNNLSVYAIKVGNAILLTFLTSGSVMKAYIFVTRCCIAIVVVAKSYQNDRTELIRGQSDRNNVLSLMRNTIYHNDNTSRERE